MSDTKCPQGCDRDKGTYCSFCAEPSPPSGTTLQEVERRIDGYKRRIGELEAERDALRRRVEELEAERELVAAEIAFYGGDDHHLCVLCSDTFAYATADCEQVPKTELFNVLAIYRAHDWRGITAWIARRRGHEPLPEIAETEEYRKVVAALTPPTPEVQGLNVHGQPPENGVHLGRIQRAPFRVCEVGIPR